MPDLIVAELVFVLESFYEGERERVVELGAVASFDRSLDRVATVQRIEPA